MVSAAVLTMAEVGVWVVAGVVNVVAVVVVAVVVVIVVGIGDTATDTDEDPNHRRNLCFTLSSKSIGKLIYACFLLCDEIYYLVKCLILITYTETALLMGNL